MLKVTGTALATVSRVTYLGSYGSGDDATVKVRPGATTASTRACRSVP